MTDSDPTAPRPPALRVGTAEREQAAAALGQHFADGRLDVAEFDERVARAYAAKTTTDLAELFTDLPKPPAPAQSAPPPRPSTPYLPVALIAILALGTAIAVSTQVFPFVMIPLLFILFAHRGRGWGHPRRGCGTA
ncbi:DUF1707 domain-containing protein [Nocardia uniformis]|uniref:DUF1707 domain-containing protein n=1 Tax=Nocardia uniformis TaxID=53432 RepID=A0A849CEF0_9NOCA|nr:DUF1707 domain-containing protein [Nocardia uniformis]NNH74955.1 DUF1707 domain-containing protein [Nocardia uniformis]